MEHDSKIDGMFRLNALSPVDGRYADKTKDLHPIFSEKGLMRRRAHVECEYLLALARKKTIPVRRLNQKEISSLKSIWRSFSDEDGLRVKLLEEGDVELGVKGTRHDVVALVVYMRERLKLTSLADVVAWLHWPLTSEDINNLAYAEQLSDALEEVIIPELEAFHRKLKQFSLAYALLPMRAETHGQPATPTTLGKESNVFATRLGRLIRRLRKYKISVKFSGATGTYAAHTLAFPHVDWLRFSQSFVRRLSKGRMIGFTINQVTTQIEPHDTYAELFDLLKQIAVVLVSFCQDFWQYISYEWLVQKAVEGEKGSSAMPFKVNPISFENGEGNLEIFIGLCEVFARVLPISRRQRHLSDSTIIRNFGLALGFLLISLKSIQSGIERIAPDSEKLLFDLEAHPEVIGEGIQIVLRSEGHLNAYDDLVRLMRGKKMTLELIHTFIRDLKLRPVIEKKLLALRPSNYLGLADKLAKRKQ